MSPRHDQSLEPWILPAITQQQLRDYAEASGDPNPIHLDERVAKQMGLPGVIAHGMLIAGFLAERAERVRREELGQGLRLERLRVRFKAMTLLGDTLRIEGTIAESGSELELRAINQRGEIVASAEARIRRET